MKSVLLNKSYVEPPFCKNEILRYAGCGAADDEILSLLDECINEVHDKLTYNVCYRVFDVSVKSGNCDFGVFKFNSEKLAVNLKNCEKAVVFAATVGVGIDRLIARYSRISLTKAYILQAIGTERIEALCDEFCADLATEFDMSLKPRFSPGYGDFSLDAQRDIFAVLDCERRIGLTLNDSMLMTPSKSVTAIIGVGGEKTICNKCSMCNMRDCKYRGII